MKPRISEQVVVITGASSGIGRETALRFARGGAKVAVAARNESALQALVDESRHFSGEVAAFPTDISRWRSVERLAHDVMGRFGRIDTWVNNAAVSLYATVEDSSLEEIERVIAVNLFGQIYGMKAILPHFKRQRRGTIINVGSVLSKVPVPLLSAYVASKHGLKGFTDCLRLELEREQCGIDVTLILPASINTPLFDNARSKLGVKPAPIPPVYDPSIVADAIGFAAEHVRREIVVGGAAEGMLAMERMSERLMDRYLLQGDRGVSRQLTEIPYDGDDNLFEISHARPRSRGSFGKGAKQASPYTRVFERHPSLKTGALMLSVVALGALLRRAA